MQLINPKNSDEWHELFNQVQTELEAIEFEDIFQLEAGEIASFEELNRHILLVNKYNSDLAPLKDKARRLKSIAEQWEKREFVKALLNVDKELYSNATIQKAYAESRSEKESEMVVQAKLLVELLHAESQRLWQYREDLQSVGHNARAASKIL